MSSKKWDSGIEDMNNVLKRREISNHGSISTIKSGRSGKNVGSNARNVMRSESS
jgi:hypothetical protein